MQMFSTYGVSNNVHGPKQIDPELVRVVCPPRMIVCEEVPWERSMLIVPSDAKTGEWYDNWKVLIVTEIGSDVVKYGIGNLVLVPASIDEVCNGQILIGDNQPLCSVTVAKEEND